MFPLIFSALLYYWIRKWFRRRRESRNSSATWYDTSPSANRGNYPAPHPATISAPKSHIVPQTTLNGEIVKSGGERIIADYLRAHGIRYEYEKPAFDATGRRISRPDFFLSDYDVYVEYWGMVNSNEKHERQEYIKSMEWKIRRYHENGKRFISIYPEDLGNLDVSLKEKLHRTSQA
ncbi:MAG TPA: hypothetical protein VJP79_00310 [Nitrososphaera sp.]|nr:hypothetical protein [Nitrososphaera sp.]